MPTTSYKPLKPFGMELNELTEPKLLRSLILENGFVLIKKKNFSSEDELVEFAMSLSDREGGIEEKLLHWDFGPLMKMKYDEEATNYLFSDEDVPFHWDGAFHKEPMFLLFHCEESSSNGGNTLFCDTSKVFEALTPDEKEDVKNIELEFQTEKMAHYGGEIRVPLVQEHPINGSTILRYADEVKTKRNPVNRNIINDSKKTIETVSKKLKPWTYSHSWETGDLLIADNFRLIHGREQLGKNTKRTFRRIQIL